MKNTIELKASEINGRLYVHMNVYAEKELVPRWSRTFPLYGTTAERIMSTYYDYYLYMPLLLCSQSKLADCKRWMSRWLTNYKKRGDIEGSTNWKYELEY